MLNHCTCTLNVDDETEDGEYIACQTLPFPANNVLVVFLFMQFAFIYC